MAGSHKDHAADPTAQVGTPRHSSRDDADDRRALRDALEQSRASREILRSLGRAADEPGQVLDTIVEHARRLCRADVAQLYLLEGDVFRLSRVSGAVSEEFRAYVDAHPMRLSRETLVGRVALDRRTQQLTDVLSDADYGRQDLQRLAGYRTLMSSPMLLGDEVVGVLSLWRSEVAPFSEVESSLIDDFATQGAIVLRQLDLTGSLEARGEELARRLAQLEALREVGDTVGSVLDLDEVLQRIVSNAVRLSGCDGGSIMEYDEDERSFGVRAAYGSEPGFVRRLRALAIPVRSTLVGSAAESRRPVQVADLAARSGRDEHLEVLVRDGWRSLLAVPLLRGPRIVGVLVIRRRTTGPFADDLVDLIETFAAQSSLAIVNAQLYRELETQSAELEVASRHKSEFLASMSHELRTPLNAVIGFSEVLQDRMFGELNERQAEYVGDIWKSGRHLLELLNEILDLSKVEAGQMVLEVTTFRVGTAVEYALTLVRERAARHGITLVTSIGEEVSTVDADELRFKQIVLNLVSNAVKFTRDGGRVEVAVRHVDDLLSVAVTDTGVGVPPEDRRRIFESFQQGGRGVAREEGTGLGLTLSRRIVELFHGRMWLESEVGVGSTFGFTIPLHPEPVHEEPVTGPEGQLPVALVVDDDRASLDLITAYLAGSAIQVERARDGVEAVTLARRLVPAVVLLDIRLPRQDGWQVLRELKQDPATAHVPVVVVSVVDERGRGLALGADDYLLKPLRRDDLFTALRHAGLALSPVSTAGGVRP